MRESKRTRTERGCALVVTMVVHGLIIYAVATSAITKTSAIPPQTISVVLVDKPRRPPGHVELPMVKLSRITPARAPVPTVQIPAEPPPAQPLVSEQPAASGGASAASNASGVASIASGTAANGEGPEGIAVYHRVLPIYSDASARAREQGNVVVGVLIDELGHVSKIGVVKSSGFRRLDQSVVDALRQWTFAPSGNASHPLRVWTKFAWGFHLDSSPANVSITLLAFDAAVAERIRAAAVPMVGVQIPSPRGAGPLRRLIATIRTGAPRNWRDVPGPLSQWQVLAKLGAVQSIQFLGFESRGLDVNDPNPATAPGLRESQWAEWELYKVKQRGGISEWLVEITPNGTIRTAQAMTCEAPCPGF